VKKVVAVPATAVTFATTARGGFDPPADPTGIGAPGVLVSVLIGVTVSEFPFTTYAVFPFGVMAIELGPLPTAIGAPVVPVAVSIGVTVFESKLATYAVQAGVDAPAFAIGLP
jgi:hypothetical protein